MCCPTARFRRRDGRRPSTGRVWRCSRGPGESGAGRRSAAGWAATSMQGRHVDGTGTVVSVPSPHWDVVRIALPPELSAMWWKVQSPSTACSLTVSAIGGNWFEVSLIMSLTTLGRADTWAPSQPRVDVITKYIGTASRRIASSSKNAERKKKLQISTSVICPKNSYVPASCPTWKPTVVVTAGALRSERSHRRPSRPCREGRCSRFLELVHVTSGVPPRSPSVRSGDPAGGGGSLSECWRP